MNDPYEVIPFRHPIDANARVPGSKSYTNRYLVIAALAAGRSTLRGVLLSDDTEAMLDCLARLGIETTVDRIDGTTVVEGCGGRIPRAEAELDVRQSGTTARFITPMVALGRGRFVIDGHPQMRGRPMQELVGALAQLGGRIEGSALPLTVIGGSNAESPIIRVAGDVSSQFLSGLLLSGPYFPGGMIVELTTELVSASYVELTLAAMAAAGVTVTRDGSSFVVPSSGYRPDTYDIEADASAASYFFAAAAAVGGRVRVEGLGAASKQGDLAFVDILARMGCSVQKAERFIEVVRDPTLPLHGVAVDMGDCSDVAQTLACVAPFADSPTTVTGIGFVRNKETDRIGSVVTELARCGIGVAINTDGYEVIPGVPNPAMIETYNDHRMAMSFSLLGLRNEGILIANPGCVAKTFPGYWDALESIRPLHAVAIDGVLGSGKTTVAKAVAERLGLDYLDTGAMYRSVALACLRRGWPLATAGELTDALRLDVGERVMLDDVDVTEAIRSPEVSKAASVVATQPEVRRALVVQQRRWARRRGGGVLEGRDIATVVLPDAPVKIYLTASVEERALRRHLQQPAHSYEQVRQDLLWRDHNDSTRAADPLQVAAGATVIDTTGCSIDEVVEAIVKLVPWEGRP